MAINRHTLGINTRTIGLGILIVFLLFAFLNPFGAIQFLIQSSIFIVIALAMVVGGQVLASVYKNEANSSVAKKSREKIYGIIGISLILLIFAVIVAMAYLSSNR